MTKLAKRTPRQDAPGALPLGDIREAYDLLQPRFDSIAYAPGRSEAHIADLGRIAKAGNELDPVAVAAFGNDWYLVDGHHRLSAYRVAGWSKPIPVKVLHSDLRGEARVQWAIQQSFADNKKNRLPMSKGDKMDGAWRAIADGPGGISKKVTATAHAVSERTVASMRSVKAELEAEGANLDLIYSWQMAQTELRRLQDAGETTGTFDFAERQRREAAKRLKGIMDMRLAPGILAAALEAYSPGIVEAMALSRPDDGDDDETFGAD